VKIGSSRPRPAFASAAATTGSFFESKNEATIEVIGVVTAAKPTSDSLARMMFLIGSAGKPRRSGRGQERGTVEASRGLNLMGSLLLFDVFGG